MYHFCTIASPDYLPFVKALHYSLSVQSSPFVLHVLITAEDVPNDTDSIRYHNLSSLPGWEAYSLNRKYAEDNSKYRWALKPLFIKLILQNTNSVIYLDNDIFFYHSFAFLFEHLEAHTILLTPHWGSFSPFSNEESFLNNLQIGLFNAGFIGVSNAGIKLLDWWLQCCLYEMTINIEKGFFVDQRYLDLCIIIDGKAGIVRHLGCNLGSWNIHQNRRLVSNNEVLINGIYPVVFIHFNNETIKHIKNGNDELLRPHFQEYERVLLLFDTTISQFKIGSKASPPRFFPKIRRRLLMRHRIKDFLIKLAFRL